MNNQSLKQELTVFDLAFDFAFEAQRENGLLTQVVSGTSVVALMMAPGALSLTEKVLDVITKMELTPADSILSGVSILLAALTAYLRFGSTRRQGGVPAWQGAAQVAGTMAFKILAFFLVMLTMLLLVFLAAEHPFLCIGVTIAMGTIPISGIVLRIP